MQKYEFCRSADSKKVHIRKEGATGTPACGAGGWYGYSSTRFKTLNPGDGKYPSSMTDICKHCGSSKTHSRFLVEVKMKETPEAVTSCIFVDINLPTKTMVTLTEAARIMSRVSSEIEKFTAIDVQGVCVRFNLKEY
jgi:hypothetical protein